jgi:hypothetical protein
MKAFKACVDLALKLAKAEELLLPTLLFCSSILSIVDILLSHLLFCETHN